MNHSAFNKHTKHSKTRMMHLSFLSDMFVTFET